MNVKNKQKYCKCQKPVVCLSNGNWDWKDKYYCWICIKPLKGEHKLTESFGNVK